MSQNISQVYAESFGTKLTVNLMAPFPDISSFLTRRSDNFNSTIVERELNDQWVNPSDVFSVLLIVGGDVVHDAVAQLAGAGWLTPVAFSFGWVAYGLTAFISAVGENRLMPPPDCSCIVINAKNGYVTRNSSWVVGRLIRDYEYWMEPETVQKREEIIQAKYDELVSKIPKEQVTRPIWTGLCVAIYEANDEKNAGVPDKDMVYWSGFVVILLQLSVAAMPCAVFGNWGPLTVTASGITFALLTGGLPSWKREKWACRGKTTDTVIITKGNGAQHAIVISGEGRGLDLETLAAGPNNSAGASHSFSAKLSVTILGVFWILLLITAAGEKTNSWFLMAIGGIGMLQNAAVAGLRRRPGALGIHLKFKEVIGHQKVMKTILAVEEKYPHFGRSMLATFFPGELRPDEEKYWADRKAMEIAKGKEKGKGDGSKVQIKPSSISEEKRL